MVEIINIIIQILFSLLILSFPINLIENNRKSKFYLYSLIDKLSSVTPRKYPDRAKQFSSKYNSENQWKLNIAHAEIVKEQCENNLLLCLKGPLKSLRQNIPEYWFVESWGDSVLIAALPIKYKKMWYRINVRYLWFLLFAGGWALYKIVKNGRNDIIRLSGLVLIPAYIFSLCILANRFDWYEGGRLKYLLEPTYFVFILVQAYWVTKSIGPALLDFLRSRLKPN